MQAAYEKALAAVGTLRSDERADAWFYRILRNTIIDQHRRNAVVRQAKEELAHEPLPEEEVPARRVCNCAFKVLPRLHDDYAEMIRAVDVDGRAVGSRPSLAAAGCRDCYCHVPV